MKTVKKSSFKINNNLKYHNIYSIIPMLAQSEDCKNIIFDILPKLIEFEKDSSNNNFDVKNVDLIITRTGGVYNIKVNNHRLEKLHKIFDEQIFKK